MPGDPEPKLYFANSAESVEAPVTAEAMEVGLLATLTRMSLNEEMNGQSLTLTLFREGENYFHDYRYIDAIRAFYLSIEHQCADGKTGKKQTIAAFRDSDILRKSIAKAGLLVEEFKNSGDISPVVASELYFEKDFPAVIEWIYLLRGGLFHQSNRKRDTDKWSPSNHIPHKSAAIVVRAVCACMAHGLMAKNFE